MPYHHMGDFGFFPFGLIGGLAWLVLIVGLALFAFWAIRALSAPHLWRWSPAQQVPTPHPATAPLDILARRFAAGEISAEEYQKARDVIAGAPKP